MDDTMRGTRMHGLVFLEDIHGKGGPLFDVITVSTVNFLDTLCYLGRRYCNGG